VQGARSGEDYDEEEFVGFEAKKELDLTEQIIQRISEEQKELLPQLPPQGGDWYLEIGYGCLIVCYLINFFVGKRTNQKLADAWYKSVQEVLEQNFTRVGMADGANTSLTAEKFVKEAHNLFKLKATGRASCIGLQATLNLKKRHDLITSLIIETFMGTTDTVTLDFLLNEESVDNYVFAVLKKKEEKKYKKEHEDLADFGGNAQSLDNLNSTLVVVSELEEITESLMTPNVLSALNTNQAEFIRIHVSDQSIVSPKYKNTLSIEFKLPSNPEKVAALTKFALQFVDAVAKLKLSKPAKAKTEKHRSKLLEAKNKETLAQRQEAIQQKKIEKLQKEKERMNEQLAKLSPDEQRKLEEKMAKKEKKRMQPKVRVLKG